MQVAPDNWAAVWAAEHTVELRAVIGGVEYGMDAISACSAHPAAFDSLAIGQAVSSTLELTLLPSGTIPKAADIHLYVRLRGGDSVTNWAPQGVYYIDTREEADYGLLALTAYDRMIFADVDYFADGIISGTWPKPAPEVVIAICSRLGVSMDDRSALDDSIMVSAPVGLTIRDVLGCIAAAHGGNFVISPSGALRLLPLEGIPEAGGTPLDCKDVTLINQPVTVSQIILTADESAAYFAGDESGYSLEAYCPFASQELADALLARLGGMQYVPVRAETAVLDPLLELGDAIEAGGHISRAYSMDITYDILCTEDLSAPIDGEVEHEIPAASSTEKLIKYTAAQTKAEIKVTTDSIQSTVEALDGSIGSRIDQKLDSITLSVTSSSSTDGQTTAAITLKVGPNSYTGYIKLDGNVDVSGQLSADALYAALGDIADLTVDRLSTSRRIVKYLASDQSDDNYIRIHDQYLEFVSGVYANGTEQASNPNGALLYWEANPEGASIGSDGYPYVDGERIFTTTTETDWPVMVYSYTELVKRSIAFEQGSDGIYSPVDVFGAGDDHGTNQARMLKSTEGLELTYVAPNGLQAGLKAGTSGYLDLYGLRRTVGLNFAGWETGSFKENIEGIAEPETYSVEFAAVGGVNVPVKIIYPDGLEMAITWA